METRGGRSSEGLTGCEGKTVPQFLFLFLLHEACQNTSVIRNLKTVLNSFDLFHFLLILVVS